MGRVGAAGAKTPRRPPAAPALRNPGPHKPRAPLPPPGDNDLVRYRILGVTQAEDDHGTAIPIPGQRLRTLLTALALHPGRVTTPDTLIDEVWPARAAANARIMKAQQRPLAGDLLRYETGRMPYAVVLEDVESLTFEH